MIEKKKSWWTGKELMLFMVISILVCLAAAFFTGTPSEIIQGMKIILISRDALITDYFALAGYGATFFNAALVLALGVFMVYVQKVSYTGLTVAALLINVGFAFFGKNPLNVMPIILGTFLYAKANRAKFSRYIYTALFGTCLAPFVTEMVYILPFSTITNFVIAMVTGIFIGFVMPSLSMHTASMHMGYNLFNVGFAAGILALIMVCVLQSFGLQSETVFLWKEGRPLEFVIGLYGYFAFTFLYGLWVNKGKIKDAIKVWRHPGRAVADFILMDGAGATLMNMGIVGIICLTYILLIQGDLSGPVIGTMLTAFGFSAFGAHPKNYIPVLIGVYFSTLGNQFHVTTPGIQMAAMCAVGIAPIAGQFGVIVGVVAGILHACVVSYTSSFYGGLNLYNNGFSCGLVAILMVPLVESMMQRYGAKVSGKYKRKNVPSKKDTTGK